MELHTKFYTFNIECILWTYPPPKPRKPMTELELEKQRALFLPYYLSLPSFSFIYLQVFNKVLNKVYVQKKKKRTGLRY